MGIDPFEIAASQSLTPPDSPVHQKTELEDTSTRSPDYKDGNGHGHGHGKGVTSPTASPNNSDDDYDEGISEPNTTQPPPPDVDATEPKASKGDEDENMDAELSKYNAENPNKIERFATILAQLTPDQMNRYESFRRSGFQKSNMKRILQSIAGCPITLPMTIVMSGVAKMFVGELVETSRIIMTERSETGPIRPCHIREAYRRLKMEGKVPKQSRARFLT